jgi:hypothetical protein
MLAILVSFRADSFLFDGPLLAETVKLSVGFITSIYCSLGPISDAVSLFESYYLAAFFIAACLFFATRAL